MRRIGFLEIAIVAFLAIMLVIGWRIYGAGEFGRFGNVVKVQHAPSELYARLTIRYDKPPIYEEEYWMQDVEGISSFWFRIRSYNCREITIKAPARAVHDVSFFFGRLDQDGVWQLIDRAPRPDPDAHYTVYVKQLADFKQGERTVKFTNPRYWSTNGSRQYEIDLSKQNPRDFVRMEGHVLAYQQIVDDFRNFGPDEFRKNVADAQRRARTSSCQ
jgi:hypothetical protein